MSDYSYHERPEPHREILAPARCSCCREIAGPYGLIRRGGLLFCEQAACRALGEATAKLFPEDGLIVKAAPFDHRQPARSPAPPPSPGPARDPRSRPASPAPPPVAPPPVAPASPVAVPEPTEPTAPAEARRAFDPRHSLRLPRQGSEEPGWCFPVWPFDPRRSVKRAAR